MSKPFTLGHFYYQKSQKMTEQNLPEYSWWGGENPPPEHLKTKNQLAELKLKPVKAVAVIPTREYDLLLYDPGDPASVAPKAPLSEARRAALEMNRMKQKYRAFMRDYGDFVADRNEAIEWAKTVLANPEGHIILDTETTGLYNAEIVEIAILRADGENLLNTLVKPSISIPQDVVKIHGIDDEAVKNAPTFPDIYPQIVDALGDRRLIIYNAAFDTKILSYCRKKHELPPFQFKGRTDCAMKLYAQFVGDYSDYFDDYKWKPLCGGHRALSDCLACLDIIKEMAATDIEDISFETWLAAEQQQKNAR